MTLYEEFGKYNAAGGRKTFAKWREMRAEQAERARQNREAALRRRRKREAEEQWLQEQHAKYNGHTIHEINDLALALLEDERKEILRNKFAKERAKKIAVISARKALEAKADADHAGRVKEMSLALRHGTKRAERDRAALDAAASAAAHKARVEGTRQKGRERIRAIENSVMESQSLNTLALAKQKFIELDEFGGL